MVNVGLTLWATSGPVRGDRIIFLDRPYLLKRPCTPDGGVFADGREWQLIEPELFETWREGRIEFQRYRALMLERESLEIVGEYYWLDTRELGSRSSPA